jgi:hypothetical protein
MKELKRLEPRKLSRAKKKPLTFIQPALDPTLALPDVGGNAETQIREEVDVVKIGMVERMKADNQRKKLATAADDYFVLAFESGDQATAFLRAIGYPSDADRFIDGTIVAEQLKIKLPAAPKQHKLKSDHDRKLTRLVNPKAFR